MAVNFFNYENITQWSIRLKNADVVKLDNIRFLIFNFIQIINLY